MCSSDLLGDRLRHAVAADRQRFEPLHDQPDHGRRQPGRYDRWLRDIARHRTVDGRDTRANQYRLIKPRPGRRGGFFDTPAAL